MGRLVWKALVHLGFFGGDIGREERLAVTGEEGIILREAYSTKTQYTFPPYGKEPSAMLS